MNHTIKKQSKPSISTADIDALIAADRVVIPPHARTPADYAKTHGCSESIARRAMQILAKKHGLKSVRQNSRTYYWN